MCEATVCEKKKIFISRASRKKETMELDLGRLAIPDGYTSFGRKAPRCQNCGHINLDSFNDPQSTNRSSGQPTNRSSGRLTNRSLGQLTNRSLGQGASGSAVQSGMTSDRDQFPYDFEGGPGARALKMQGELQIHSAPCACMLHEKDEQNMKKHDVKSNEKTLNLDDTEVF